MQRFVWLVVGLITSTVIGAEPQPPKFEHPLVARYGGIAPTSGAAEQPRRGAKIVFDIVAESKPGEVNKGLESVARYLNLNAAAGLKSTDVKLALVLHGGATKASLADAAYSRQTGTETNPNLPLIRELKKHGVEVFVCGQSLARNQYPQSDVAGDVTIAVSAMTVNVNKQLDGYAYLSIH